MSEAGGHLLDSQAFRRFVNTVGVVAAEADGQFAALAAEWCTPVSIEPRLLGVYVGHERFSMTVLAHAEAFGLSILAAGQAGLSHELGSRTGWHEPKRPWWEPWAEWGAVLRVPLVKGASAVYECVVEDRRTYGDHVLLVARPVAARTAGDDDPLLYHGGRYFRLGALVEKPPVGR